MSELLFEYYKSIKDAKDTLISKLKDLYPVIYVIEVNTECYYNTTIKKIACFSDEEKAKNIIGSGKWGFWYQFDDWESSTFKIIQTNTYEDLNLDFNLLLNIDKYIDMSHYGKMDQ